MCEPINTNNNVIIVCVLGNIKIPTITNLLKSSFFNNYIGSVNNKITHIILIFSFQNDNEENIINTKIFIL